MYEIQRRTTLACAALQRNGVADRFFREYDRWFDNACDIRLHEASPKGRRIRRRFEREALALTGATESAD